MGGERRGCALWGVPTQQLGGHPRLHQAPAGVSDPLRLDPVWLLCAEVRRVNAVKVEGLTVML